MYTLRLNINGQEQETQVHATTSLLTVLREQLGITGPKLGCNTGDCGSCSVILDGRLVKACITNALACSGKEVLTVEGLATGARLHPLQQAFHHHAAAQCGFCTPGMLMAGVALLAENPHPSRSEVREALAGNLCRCTGYAKIVDAVLAAAGEVAQAGEEHT